MFSSYFFSSKGEKKDFTTSNKKSEFMFQQNWLDELKHGNAVSDIQEIEKKNSILWVRLGDAVEK